MTILGGMGHFWGPVVGRGAGLLNQQITSYTQYWPFVLGMILIVLLFAFPGGILGAIHAGRARLPGWRLAGRAQAGDATMLEVRDIRSLSTDLRGRRSQLRRPRRQIAAVIGPNGAGKSTLFNSSPGICSPDAGRVWLAGRDITGAPPHRICRMGMGRSFQRTNIFPGSRCSRTCRPLISPIAGAVRISGRARSLVSR